MVLIKNNTTSIKVMQSEKCEPRKGVEFESKFVISDGDEAIQSSHGTKRRYKRRGSKSVSMLAGAITVYKNQYDMNERVILGIRGSPSESIETKRPLKLWSTVSLIDEVALLEKLLVTTAARTGKAVVV